MLPTSTLPAINPEYAETATGAHLVGVLDDPEDQLEALTVALTDQSIRLSAISVYGRRAALRAFRPDIDPMYRPQVSRIIHRFDARDHNFRAYERALATNHALVSVRVNVYERHRVADAMKRRGVRDVGFYSRRHHRRLADDFHAGGNAMIDKRLRP